MIKGKMTPGPWEAHTMKDKHIEILHPLINTEGEYKGQLGGYHIIVGNKNCEKGYILDKENAQAIAALPDLIEALKACMERIEKDEYSQGWKTSEEYKQARASLIKAGQEVGR